MNETSLVIGRSGQSEELTEQRSIVNPNGKNDLILQKIQSLKVQNLNSRDRQKVAIRASKFVNAYVGLAWKCGGLSRRDLSSFSEDELRQLHEAYLSDLIMQSAWKAWVFYFSNPIGWVGGIAGLMAAFIGESDYTGKTHCYINYAIQMRSLKKICGKNWFPAKEIIAKVTPTKPQS